MSHPTGYVGDVKSLDVSSHPATPTRRSSREQPAPGVNPVGCAVEVLTALSSERYHLGKRRLFGSLTCGQGKRARDPFVLPYNIQQEVSDVTKFPARLTGATYLTGLVCLASFPAQSQTPASSAKPAFEVASIRQLPQTLPPGQVDLSFVGTGGQPFKIAGNRITMRATLRAFIAAAYNLKEYQVTGEPAWGDSVIYNITAKSPGEEIPTQEQVRLMFQSLLADRFQLKLHHDTKEMSVFHLSIAKPMPAFTPAGPDETFSWKLTPGPDKNVRSKATKETIGDFVQLVAASTDRPVIDKTGVTGYIDYEIVFPQDETDTRDDTNIRILDAVKKQLGMKLEPAKDQIGIVVVDRVEKASDN
jgi:uncharacterized protein (TIGR03435 family)